MAVAQVPHALVVEVAAVEEPSLLVGLSQYQVWLLGRVVLGELMVSSVAPLAGLPYIQVFMLLVEAVEVQPLKMGVL